jgi:MFS transporter, Spinster family, sphingosine-1-phosphate transporter
VEQRDTTRSSLSLSSGRVACLVGVMWGAYFLNYCDRQAVFAMFTSLRTDLQMSDTQLGLTGSVFLWVYGLACPVAGYLADRFSKRRLIIASLMLWSGVTIATGLANSASMMIALRAMMGISEALFMPAAIAFTANATPSHQRSRAIAILTTAQIAGTIGGSWFGGWMSENGMWRTAFYVLGGLGLVYALPYRYVLAGLDSGKDTAANKPAERTSWMTLGSTPSFLILCVVFPVFVFGLWMLYSWLPNYLEGKFQLGPKDAALMATATAQPATLVGLFLGGFLADRWAVHNRAARWWLLVASLMVCAPCLHGIGQSESYTTTCIALIGFGLFSGFMIGNIFPSAFEVLPDSLRASGVGVLNFFGAALSGFAPLVVGKWKETIGIENMMSYTAIAYLAAGVLVMLTIHYRLSRDLTALGKTKNP